MIYHLVMTHQLAGSEEEEVTPRDADGWYIHNLCKRWEDRNVTHLTDVKVNGVTLDVDNWRAQLLIMGVTEESSSLLQGNGAVTTQGRLTNASGKVI